MELKGPIQKVSPCLLGLYLITQVGCPVDAWLLVTLFFLLADWGKKGEEQQRDERSCCYGVYYTSDTILGAMTQIILIILSSNPGGVLFPFYT